MKITRDVITDLLPAYFAGEASSDTRALVEDYLSHDPEFARTVEAQKSELASRVDLLKIGAADLPPDLEVQTLVRTRAMIRRRSWMMALAWIFTTFPFSFAFENGRFTFILMRDVPVLALLSWLAAATFWLLYFRARRRLRTTGL